MGAPHNITHTQETMKKADQRYVPELSSGSSSKLDDEMFPLRNLKLAEATTEMYLRSRIKHGWHFSKNDPNQPTNGAPKTERCSNIEPS